MDFLEGKERTVYCGEFTQGDIGKQVVAVGWAAKRRDFGGLIFVDLRDRTGKIQVVFNSEKFGPEFTKAEQIRNEFVLCVEGVVVARDAETINPKLPTGYIEIRATSLKILSESNALPFSLDEDIKINEALRLKYRYLDIRHEHMQSLIKLRSETAKIVRNFLSDNNFLEVETPILGKSTPEGARDYLVPSRVFPGSFFALPQSPQLYKQLLMIGGIDRYYQIAKCFRDEDLRADRQPEFTQIDVEMSFVDKEEQVMLMIENLVRKVFSETIKYNLPDTFNVITYEEAMNSYGSDKPDTRFDLKIVDMSEFALKCSLDVFVECVEHGGSVRVINAKGLFPKFARRDLDALSFLVKDYGVQGLSWIAKTEEGIKGNLAKFFNEELLNGIIKKSHLEVDDILFFIGDHDNSLVLNALGKLRLYLANKFSLINEDVYEVLWVKEFPLLEYDKEQKRFVAMHHPFTSPKEEDLHLLTTNPEKVRAKAYDLVVNGNELGGGSIRIYNKEIQDLMFKTLGFSEQDIQEKFGFFVNAFSYGTPPHGGLAIGFDRLIMLLAKTTDIRSVIAFPKIQSSMDLMTLAPGEVENKQLKELGIAVKKEIIDLD